ncbi:MAG: translational machinery protein [Actinomycetota bacterium]|nr:translational machinery protein [Actinomycetota bacterium]
MSYSHAVVWIDHQHATVIDFTFDDQHVVAVEREGGQRKLHRKSGFPGSGKAATDHHFYDEVATALGNASEVLIVGPGNAKVELHHDLQVRHAALAKRVVGVESVDHPSDGALLAHARKYFKRYDALRGDA